MKTLIVSKENDAIIKNGGVALAVNMADLSRVKVAMVEGVPCMVISTLKAYSGVKLYDNSSSELNLTEQETKDLIAKKSLIVYRSSGATDEHGETLTRAEQIKRGVARAIELAYNTEENKAYIIKDNSASYGEKVALKVIE